MPKASALVLGSLALAALASGGGGQEPASRSEADWQAFQKTVLPFLTRHCFECHTDKKSGDVRLDQFQDAKTLALGAATLDRVQVVLRKRAMPPKKKPQPDAEAARPVLAWLESFVEGLERESRLDRVTLRRLNRAEYNNTVRDLLGVDFRPGDEFPADVPAHGFDNVGSVLSVSPVLVEKYLSAAEKVARAALFGPEATRPVRVAHQPFCTADAFSKNTDVKTDYDESGLSLPSALHVTQFFAVSGDYDLRAVLRGWRPAGSNPVELAFWIDGRKVHEARVAVPTARLEGRGPGEMNGLWAECRVPVPPGEHWLSVSVQRMYEGLPPRYKGPKPAAEVEVAPDAPPERVDGKKPVTERVKSTDSFFPMYLDVVGPYRPVQGPAPASVAKIFREGREARRVVTDLARRAYRRPVTDADVDTLVQLVARAQKDGDSLEEGICLAIQRLLISPNFLFRMEKNGSAHELATRLSYFLWSSMPDDELLGSDLSRPEVLEAQVRRMLQDGKSFALVENFGGQWLQTRALEGHLPNRAKFTEFTDYTGLSMKQETELFFRHILREDRPILDFLDADYTFLNQRLAEFYGIPGVRGHEFRKVDLKGTPYGGVWTQASVLTVSSYANRTSPVLRGKWILETLLNAPPPPPPPNVPALDEDTLGKDLPLQKILEQHRTNAMCASCHARLDPLGFALEHFDAIGRWREQDGKFPIDTAGSLPDGRSFKGHEDLRALLKADAVNFTEGLVQKMLIYALGRGLEPSDRRSVRSIVDRVAKEEYRFSSLVLGIVRSESFQGGGR